VKSSKSKSKAKSKAKPKSKTKSKSKAKLNPPTIGFLVSATKSIWSDFITAFTTELTNKGWKIGSTVKIDQQEANGDEGQYESIAATFVKNGYDVIVTAGTEAALACQIATTQANPNSPIPVVFASAGDPLYSGLVTSLSHPTGTNLTGCSNMQTDATFTGNRVTKLKKNFKPTLVGVVGYPLRPIDKAIDAAVNTLTTQGIPVFTPTYLGYLAPSDFASVATIEARLKLLTGVDVLYVCSDPLLRSNADNLVKAAHNLHMKTMHEFSEWETAHNGDDWYGPDFTDLFSRAADAVDQILKKTNPVNMIDVYQPPPPPLS
jgi:putative ABC transport system substrate-binding protein